MMTRSMALRRRIRATIAKRNAAGILQFSSNKTLITTKIKVIKSFSSILSTRKKENKNMVRDSLPKSHNFGLQTKHIATGRNSNS